MIKVNPYYLIIVILCLCVGYLYFKNNTLEKKIDEYKILELQKENLQINKIDSIFSERQKQQIKKIDSVYLILSKKDSLLERKNKLQDEKIRNITIPVDLLPNF